MPTASKPPVGPLDCPPCLRCGGATRMSRRAPHPELGLPAELWSFECRNCGALRTIAVAADGTPLD